MVTWSVCPGEEPIAAYAAGRLPRNERDAIDSHLDTCSACSELVAMLAKAGASGAMAASTIGGAEIIEDDRLLAGHLGRYVLLARIGAGGLGIVYSAYDPELDRRVALKLLRRTREGALRVEARNIAKLAHANVVAVHDVGRVDDTEFVAMEYVDGITLREWLESPRTVDEILAVFVQAGRGIVAAHAAGLVHRDIKPSNIMIGADGRVRVLDFGLASPAGASEGGTPAYMAPEQARGEAVDARADQYAFCVALWEALGGDRPTKERTPVGMLVYAAEPVVKALRRGLSEDPAQRFPTLEALLAELVPPPSRKHVTWLVAAIVALVGILVVTLAVSTRHEEPCTNAGAPAALVWGDDQRAAVRAAFAKVPYAKAQPVIESFDRWTTAWQARALASCKSTADLVQSPQVQALRQTCLDQLLERMRAVVKIAPTAIDRAEDLVPSVPSPERCDAVGAVEPPGENLRAAVAAAEKQLAVADANLVAGAPVEATVPAIDYPPLAARALFVRARIENVKTHFTAAIALLHQAAQLATRARDQELLAEIWIELVKSLGNDPRFADEADLFDGYVSALIPQLPDRAALDLALEHARCSRNVTRDATAAIAHCEAAIQLATAAKRPALANAELVRLGHFQRMQGRVAEAVATGKRAVADAERVFGPQHPDTAIALYALGIAEIGSDAGLADLQRALAIRRAAYPSGSPALAESLQGLGDALASADRHAEAVPLLEEGIAMLDRLHQGETAEAANLHLLAGMSLEELHRPAEAIAHDLRGADIADKSLEHREEIAAMGLRMAASLEPDHAVGLTYVERALHLLERGKASPYALGKTQLAVAVLTPDTPRAHALAVTARANLVVAGAEGAEDLADADAFLKTH